MKTWNDYKVHVKNIDPKLAKDLEEVERVSAIVSVMVALQSRDEENLAQENCR